MLAASMFVGLGSAGADTPPSTLPALPVSIAVPITALGNAIAGTALPGQGAASGSNSTTQSSPVANVSAPVNACSISAGVAADANSSCSTMSVGTNQFGAVGNVNVPITANDNAVGLLGQAASALGLSILLGRVHDPIRSDQCVGPGHALCHQRRPRREHLE